MAKQQYEVAVEQGIEVVGTMKEVKDLLGVSRLTKKEVEQGLVDGVALIDVVEEEDTVLTNTQEADNELTNTQEDTNEQHEDTEDSTTDTEPVGTEAVQDTEEPTAPVQEASDTSDEEGVEYPEVGSYDDPKQLKKFYKGLSVEQLEEWVALEGLETKPTDSAPIYRMRLCMAVLNHHFPKTPSKPKSKRKYPQSTEELVEMAMNNDVEVQDDKGDERILRMYTIMALKKAGILE